MKSFTKIFCAAGLALCSIASCLAITPIVTDPSIPAGAHQLLTNKMLQIASKNECPVLNEEGYSFTCSADVLSKEMTATTPAMHAMTLSVNFFLIDDITGDVLATNTVEVKGAGKTPEKAMISALKTIKPNAPGFKRMLDKAAKKLCPEPPAAPVAEPAPQDSIAQ